MVSRRLLSRRPAFSARGSKSCIGGNLPVG
jgi:hypothetical protein